MKGFKSNFKSIILLCLYIKYFRLFGFTGSQVSWIPTHIPCLNTKAEACCVAFDPLPAKIPHSLLSLVHYLWCVLTKKWYQKILVTYLQVVPMNCSYLLTMIKPRMLKQCNKNIDSNTTIQVFSIRIHTMLLVQPHALCPKLYLLWSRPAFPKQQAPPASETSWNSHTRAPSPAAGWKSHSCGFLHNCMFSKRTATAAATPLPFLPEMIS